MEMSGQLHAPASLTPGEMFSLYPLCRMLGGPQNRSGRGGVETDLFPRPSTLQSFAALTGISLLLLKYGKRFKSTFPRNYLTSWIWALLEQSPVVQLLKNFPTFYGNRRFITVFTRALHWSLSWANSVQSIPPHPISLRSILILFTHLHVGLSNGLVPSGFPTKILYASVFFPFVLMPFPSHPLHLVITVIHGEGCKLWSS
jgi:hypothetical protein